MSFEDINFWMMVFTATMAGGTFLTILINVILNYKDRALMRETIEQNKKLVFLDLKKIEMGKAIEKAREYFKYINVYWKDYEVNFFLLFIIQCKSYFNNLPKYIQEDIKDFLYEISENNNLKLDNSFLKASKTINVILESGNGGFMVNFSRIDVIYPYRNEFDLVHDLCKNISDDDKERINNFCLEQSKYLKNHNIDKILDKEFFSSE